VLVTPSGDDLYDLTPRVLDNLSDLGVDVLVTIGGDDTLSYSQVLVNEGIALMAIPKTMDNDVQGTEYCIGFSTAITRAKEAINRQRTTLGSHERIGVFRIFGRGRGVLGAVHGVRDLGPLRHPEAPYDLDALCQLLAADHAANPSHYAFVRDGRGRHLAGARR
jgi:6-phosphofructokinase 1